MRLNGSIVETCGSLRKIVEMRSLDQSTSEGVFKIQRVSINFQPSGCEADALPAELRTRTDCVDSAISLPVLGRARLLRG
jgi:hypothetical protein